jgi:DNA repair protein RadA/Sms
MSKTTSVFICQECGHQSSKWLGRCPDCGQWNSLVEEEVNKKTKRVVSSSEGRHPKKISEINQITYERFQTKINEFDRVLGGGVTMGSLTLLGGEPGIGKSTLLMEVCGCLSKEYSKSKILYVSGEESESQVGDRAVRLGVNGESLYILNETSWQKILSAIKDIKPDFFILDSIQTTVSDEVTSAAGTVSQIRDVTYEIMNYAKNNKLTCFIIGHVTKEGSIAGPKILEHMVDTVVYFEGDQFGQYRMLRVIKNRFGNTNEVGIFEMNESGLQEVKNPSQYFLEETLEDSYGRSICCILEGTRPLFVEIQALAVENRYGNARRTTQGMDANRLSLLVAVIDKYFEIPLSFNDLYVNVVGGIKLNNRDSDLAIIASLLSSHYKIKIDSDTVFIGEVGLTGEVRSVPMVESRIKEMAQLNYKRVVTSKRIAKELTQKYNIEIIGIDKAKQITELLFK